MRTDDVSGLPERRSKLESGAGSIHSVVATCAAIFRLGMLVLLVQASANAQDPVAEAREAMAAGRAAQARDLLTATIETNPTADAYLYLGIALANLSQADQALDTLTDGSARYPLDARFHDEIAGVHLSGRNIALAIESLERAIELDPQDGYATDLLASIRLSEGDVRQALATWNSIGQPEIDRVLQNFAPGLLDRAVPDALAFGPGDVLRFPAWKTTEVRLFRSRLYSNVGIELEPSAAEERFNAIVRTSPNRNTRNDILFDLVRGLLRETIYLDVWDIARSGVSWRSNYRWDKDRRRLSGQVVIPLPLAGLPVLELSDTWRQERWNIDVPARDVFQADVLFEYKVNTMAFDVAVTPHYRVTVHGGLEYRNRDVTGTIAMLGMDERNSGTLNLGTVVRPIDGRFQNQIRAGGYLARASFLGDFDFSGGTVQVANRYVIRDQSQTFLDFSASGGTIRGEVPVDYYYILGLSSLTDHALRAHAASDGGRYGQAPMGTDFVLFNTDLEHRIATLPMFNTLSIPYVHVKVMGFFDAGKTFDRNRVFRQDQWYRDAGAGVRFETPTNAFTILYGRDLAGGENSFYAYVEPNLW